MTPSRRGRTAAIAAAIAALITLAALAAGVPVLLWLISGSPIPHALPSGHQVAVTLASRDTGTLFLGVVRYIAWLAWLGFAASLLVELYCQARGVRAPQLGPASGLQHVARGLITAVLIGFTSSGAAVPLVVPTAAITSTAPAGPAAHATLEASLPQTIAPGSARPPADTSRPAPAPAVTIRAGDCLWTLAQRYLGAGDRWPEIAALNNNHPMGDGLVFSDPSYIRPGWVLQLPATTKAASPAAPAPAVAAWPAGDSPVDTHTGHPSAGGGYFAAAHATAAAYTPRHQAPSAGGPPPAATTTAEVIHDPATAAPASAPERLPVFTAGMAAGGLLASIATLRYRQRQDRRRGRRIALPASGVAARAERQLQAATTPADAATVRTALAMLADGLRRQERPVPPAVGLHVAPTALDVLLTEPGAAPPAPFTITPGTRGMSWRLSAAASLPPVKGAGHGDILPGLITAGTTGDGAHLLIDLETLGVTTIDGGRSLVDRFMIGAAAEIATNLWAGSFDLLLQGFPDLAGVSSRAQACRTLDEAITLLQERAQQTPSPASPRQQRLADPACPDGTLTLLIARTPPSGRQLSQILDVAGPASGIAALLAADPETADGREAPASLDLQQEPGGVTATLHPYGLVLRPQLIDPTSYRALAEIFDAARHPDIAPDAPPYDDAAGALPQPGRHGAADGARPQASHPGQARPGGAGDRAPLQISILGPLAITGSAVDPQPKQNELVVALALAGTAGMSNEALRGYLGPDEDHPKPSDQLRQIITRTRRKLGPAPGGGPYIIYASTGQYVLDEATQLDWHIFQDLARAGQADRDAGALRAALAMVRGQPFEGLYYWWIPVATIEAIRAEICDAAETLAHLELQAGDAPAAARAARAGLAADDTAEQLWRALMQAEDAAGNAAKVHAAWRDCLAAIADIAADGEPHPATTALYRELTAPRAAAARR